LGRNAKFISSEKCRQNCLNSGTIFVDNETLGCGHEQTNIKENWAQTMVVGMVEELGVIFDGNRSVLTVRGEKGKLSLSSCKVSFHKKEVEKQHFECFLFVELSCVP
jgi:hypothetical protein